MIINAKDSTVEVIGDVQEFKTGIDPKNLEFITTLLSSNLYSAPENSFVREIVSNAWDSHVEAGNTDTPVLVKIDSKDNSITVRDFGVGLSPERFKNIFCNIGSSTKRESNDFIGGFGIGRFSALACSNTVYINSYYKGTMYLYIMCKSGNSITTNLVATLPTDEKDGVEISIKNVSKLQSYVSALDYIVFFPNVYVECSKDLYCNFNNINIKKYKNYAVASEIVRHKLLLGNVLYPLDSYQLNLNYGHELTDFIHSINNTAIVIKFDIGELEVTPNRENIIYTESTKNKIKEKLIEAKKELLDCIQKNVKRDYTNLYDYFKASSKSMSFNCIKNKAVVYGEEGFRGNVSFIPKNLGIDFTYKGVSFKAELEGLKSILNCMFPNLKGIIGNNKIYLASSRFPYDISKHAYIHNKKIIIIPENTRLTATIKSYLRINYDEYAILYKMPLDVFIKKIKEDFAYPITKSERYFITELYNDMISSGKEIDFTTDSSFLKYKEEQSKSKEPTTKITDVIIYTYDKIHGSYISKNKKYFKTLQQVVGFIKSQKRGIVLSYISDSDYTNAHIASVRGFLYITANKQVITELMNLNFKNIVSLEFLLQNDKVLAQIATMVSNNFMNMSQSILDTIPEPIRTKIISVQTLYNKYGQCYEYIRHVKNNITQRDSYIEYICNESKKYYDSYMKAVEYISKHLYCRDTVLIHTVILKLGLYRIPYDKYKEIHNNQLISLLCKKQNLLKTETE